MKKGLLLVLLILFSCQKDEILVIDQTPTYTMIFENDGVAINDGQDVSFDITETTQHQLIITTHDGSVLTKESFQPEVGLNTRKIFTRILPPNTYNLILIKGDTEINKVRIIVE
jgi:hypothetical protein